MRKQKLIKNAVRSAVKINNHLNPGFLKNASTIISMLIEDYQTRYSNFIRIFETDGFPVSRSVITKSQSIEQKLQDLEDEFMELAEEIRQTLEGTGFSYTEDYRPY